MLPSASSQVTRLFGKSCSGIELTSTSASSSLHSLSQKDSCLDSVVEEPLCSSSSAHTVGVLGLSDWAFSSGLPSSFKAFRPTPKASLKMSSGEQITSMAVEHIWKCLKGADFVWM